MRWAKTVEGGELYPLGPAAVPYPVSPPHFIQQFLKNPSIGFQ